MKRFLLMAAVPAAAVVVLLVAVRVPGPSGPPSVSQDRIVAVVNGQPITAGYFSERFRRFTMRMNVPAGGIAPAASELKMGFLKKMIETTLLLQEARLRAIEVTEQELNDEIQRLKEDYPKDTLDEALERIGLKLEQWKEERREKLLIDKLIHREVDSVIHVSDEEIREYYRRHKEEFHQPLRVRARQIVVATEDEANALRSRILKGEDFAELARRYSLSPDGERGGDLGVFARGQMPEEFDEVVFRYRVGAVSRVVQSPYGFHIFKVEKRIYPRTPDLEEVRDKIAERIFSKRQELFFQEWLDSLKHQAEITIYPEVLEEI